MSETVPAVPRRVHPALRRVAIVAFAILLPVAAHGLWDYVEVRRLAREIQRIIDRGEPVSLANEPRPKGGPDAASYYIAGGVLALRNSPFGALGPVRDWLAEPMPDRRALEPLLEPLRQRVEAAQDALRLADAAASLPFEGYPPGTDFNSRESSVSSLSELATARTLSLSAQGDGDGAVRSVISRLQIERMESPFAISGHQTAAVLSLSQPSPAALRQLQTALATLDDPGRSVRLMTRDRARFLEMAWRLSYGPDTTNPSRLTIPGIGLVPPVMRPAYSRQLADQQRLWSELIDIARQPWPAGAAARRAALARAPDVAEAAGFTLASPQLAWNAFRNATDPTRLIVDRASLAAVAVERYRRDHADALPPTLAALVPEYLASVPSDPFTGRDLLVRTSALAYTIYSVGVNATDDGGALTRPAPRGNARPRVRGDDVGVRVLTVSR